MESRYVTASLFWFESQAERGFADAELGALAEHGGADTLFFEEGAVGGIEIAKIDVIVADLDDAMVARDFRILQSDVGAVATDDDARFFQRMSSASAGTGNDREDDIFGLRQDGRWILHYKRRLRAGGVAAGERW